MDGSACIFKGQERNCLRPDLENTFYPFQRSTEMHLAVFRASMLLHTLFLATLRLTFANDTGNTGLGKFKHLDVLPGHRIYPRGKEQPESAAAENVYRTDKESFEVALAIDGLEVPLILSFFFFFF